MHPDCGCIFFNLNFKPMKNLKKLSDEQIDELTSFISSLCLNFENYSHVSDFAPKSIYDSIIKFHTKIIAEINIRAKAKEPKIYEHKVLYYKNGIVVDCAIMAEVVNHDLYWHKLLSDYKPERGFIIIDKYKIVNACVKNFDYCINELIEK